MDGRDALKKVAKPETALEMHLKICRPNIYKAPTTSTLCGVKNCGTMVKDSAVLLSIREVSSAVVANVAVVEIPSSIYSLVVVDAIHHHSYRLSPRTELVVKLRLGPHISKSSRRSPSRSHDRS